MLSKRLIIGLALAGLLGVGLLAALIVSAVAPTVDQNRALTTNLTSINSVSGAVSAAGGAMAEDPNAATPGPGTPAWTPPPTFTPEPLLVGHVTWQGRPTQPNTLNRLPITLTLRVGNMTVPYPNLQTDASGTFTVPVGTIYPGPYIWWIKGPRFLGTSGSGTLTGAAVTTQDIGLQPTGDVNNDNAVDVTDFSLVRAGFGRSCGDAAYDARADVNGDCTVDVSDFTLVRGNFGQAGPAQLDGPCQIFPSDNIWNRNVAALPTHVLSTAYIARIGITDTAHPDFGACCWQGMPIGVPYLLVPGVQPRVTVTFQYANESDRGPYPVPTSALMEGGPNSNGDRHVLVVDRDACVLYELYRAYPQTDGNWTAGSGAIWALNSHALRPDGWTSSDAAGLPVLPGLARYDEVATGVMRHALRFTAPTIQRAHVWPARHHDNSASIDPTLPPYGLRVRLKASVDISGYPQQARVVLQTLKDYGMILADQGPAWHITGAPDPRWNNQLLHTIENLHGSDFEVVDTAGLMIDPNSGQSR
jgi:hypothetical protein